MEAAIAKMGAGPNETRYLGQLYNANCEDPKNITTHVPYIDHFHGKCYDLNEKFEEESIPTAAIVEALIEGGFDGYICAEYEGQRTIQDAFDVDACEQVRRHHILLRRAFGEIQA